MRLIAAILVITASLSLPLGLMLPVMELKRLFVLTDTPSILNIVAGLWTTGDRLLALVVSLVSVVLPIGKLVAVNIMLAETAHARTHVTAKIVALLSKWSMLDVVLVAIAIFAAKTSGLAAAVSKPGLWFFAGSAVLAAIAASLAGRLINKDPEQP